MKNTVKIIMILLFATLCVLFVIFIQLESTFSPIVTIIFQVTMYVIMLILMALGFIPLLGGVPNKKPSNPDLTQVIQFLARVKTKKTRRYSLDGEYRYSVVFVSRDKRVHKLNLQRRQFESLKKGDNVVLEKRGLYLRFRKRIHIPNFL